MIEDVDDFSMGTTPPNGSEKGPVVAKSNNPGIEIQTIRPNTENL